MHHFNVASLLGIVSLIVFLIGGWIGYKIKAYIDRKEVLVSKASEKRREISQNFINILIGLLQDQKSGNTGREVTTKTIQKLYEFYKPYILYASPKTIKSFGDMMQLFYSQPTDVQRVFSSVGRVFLSMREEIGLSNRGLKETEFFRALITDYNKIFK